MPSEYAVTAEASVTSKNLSKVALLRLAQYPFTLLFAVLVPRLLQPEAYGRYAWFVSVVAMVAAFLDLGITEISARFVPELQRSRGETAIIRFFSRMLGFKATLNVVLVATAAVVAVAVGPVAQRQFLWPLLLVVLITDLSSSAYGLLFGLNRLALCASRDPLRRALTLVTVIVAFAEFGLMGAIFSVLIVETVMAALFLVWTRRYLSERELAPSWEYAAPLLRYGALFYLSWGVLNVWQRLGNSLIGALSGDFRQVAVFDLSNQIFLTAVGFTLFVISSLAPMFTRLRLEGKEGKLVDWSRRIVTYCYAGCTVAMAAWLLIGAPLIPILVGARYGGLYTNVAVLLCGTFPMVVVQLGLTLAMAYAEPIWYFIGLCVAVVCFVGTALLLAPHYGALGCSVATMFSCLCAALAISARYRTNMRRSLGSGLKAIAAGAIVLLPCWLLRSSPARNGVLLLGFVAVYPLVLLVARIVRRDEISQAWQALVHRQA